jgi:hypothetical protein
MASFFKQNNFSCSSSLLNLAAALAPAATPPMITTFIDKAGPEQIKRFQLFR